MAKPPPAGSTTVGGVARPLRLHYSAELDQMRLQAELMAVRVGEAVGGACEVLRSGDRALAASVVARDAEIDAMLVSLTERCYEVIAREAPVASDLRLLVSVLRILETLERIGDLSLGVVQQVGAHELLVRHPDVLATLQEMAVAAERTYEIAMQAWSGRDPELVVSLAARYRRMEEQYGTLLCTLRDLRGSDATAVTIAAVLVGRSLERIGDHAVVIGERLRYLLTGDPSHLAGEVRS